MHPSRRAVWRCSTTAQALHPAAHAPACERARALPTATPRLCERNWENRKSAGDDDSATRPLRRNTRDEFVNPLAGIARIADSAPYRLSPTPSSSSPPLPRPNVAKRYCRTLYKCIVHVYCAYIKAKKAQKAELARRRNDNGNERTERIQIVNWLNSIKLRMYNNAVAFAEKGKKREERRNIYLPELWIEF